MTWPAFLAVIACLALATWAMGPLWFALWVTGTTLLGLATRK